MSENKLSEKGHAVGSPYLTQNTALAATLSALGVPWWRVGGAAQGVFSIYTLRSLSQYKDARGKPVYYGRGLEEAARHAWQNGRPGIIVYRFQITEDANEILTGWRKQEERLEKMAQSGREVPNADGGEGMGGLGDLDPQLMGRIACQIFKNRHTIMGQWKNQVPWIAIRGNTRTEKEGDKIVTIGDLRARPIDATPETKAKLKF